jgi:hypothetical protein
MGIKAVSFLMLVNVFHSSCIYAGVSVRGYYRSNGTYVSPHMRSNPDGNFYNNWSTVGNINPYTEKKVLKQVLLLAFKIITTLNRKLLLQLKVLIQSMKFQ